MYQRNLIQQWIKEGEGPFIDFKQSITSLPKIARSIVAFANSRGGTIVVGVEDKGHIVGVDIDEQEYVLEKAAQQFCSPPIDLAFEAYEYGHKMLLLVDVAESTDKPHLAIDKKGREKVYVRIADACVVPENWMLEILQKGDLNGLQRNNNYNHLKKALISYLRNHASINVKQYMEQFNCSERSARRALLDLLFEGVIALQNSTSMSFVLGKWA